MQSATLSATGLAAAEVDVNTPLYPVPAGAKAPGITMFDWLAAVAMQSLVTHGMKVKDDRAMTEADKDLDVAQRAYQLADAMLQVRAEVLRKPL